MYCRKCGAEIKESENFCPKCGESQNNDNNIEKQDSPKAIGFIVVGIVLTILSLVLYLEATPSIYGKVLISLGFSKGMAILSSLISVIPSLIVSSGALFFVTKGCEINNYKTTKNIFNIVNIIWIGVLIGVCFFGNPLIILASLFTK